MELIITIALMVILFTLYWSRGAAPYQQKQKRACSQNLQTIYLALQSYASDHNEKYPSIYGSRTSEAPLSLLVPQYTTRTELFICPGSKDKALPAAVSFKDRRISYAYLMGLDSKASEDQWIMSDRQVSTEPKSKGAKTFSPDGKPPGSNHHKYGGVVLFANGSTELTESQTGYELTRPNGTAILNPNP